VTAYLDYNATAPLIPEARAALLRYLDEEVGNAGSRTHMYGLNAKQAVEASRKAIARLVAAEPEEIVFTSGATEANNIALLGLQDHAHETGRRHIVSTTIEHKAILEPLDHLQRRGFDVTLVPVGSSGWVDPASIAAALRADTVLVSVMQANNETGVLQPVDEIAERLANHAAYFHVDAAQGFGKTADGLQSPRIDLISLSAHKLFAPRGVGALVARRRGYERPPLRSLMFGGGQERGLRPGTLPVPLIAAFGAAAERALHDGAAWRARCEEIRLDALTAFADLNYTLIGDQDAVMPHVLSIAFEGVDSEALMLALKDLAAFSNGSACTSAAYSPSHVLAAMGVPDHQIGEVVRLSWSHMSTDIPWTDMARRIADLQPS
jgi:cysteine desulfurase